MKGGLQFINPDDTIELNTLSLYGDDKNLKYKKIEVQTNLNLVDGKPLKFTLYNIEDFNEYKKEEFDLKNLDINKDITHLYLCGFLTNWRREELFIKKGKVGYNVETFKEIGKALKQCNEIKTDFKKIQIILAHSEEKKTLCIIFDMSKRDSEYYDSLKKSLSTIKSDDEKKLEGKIKASQLENLIEFTNEKLRIEQKKEAIAKILLRNDYVWIEQKLKIKIKYDKLVNAIGQSIIDKALEPEETKETYDILVESITNHDNIVKIINILTKSETILYDKSNKNPDSFKKKKIYVTYILNQLKSLKNNIVKGIEKSKTSFLLKLLFPNAKVTEPKTESDDKKKEEDANEDSASDVAFDLIEDEAINGTSEEKSKTSFLLKLLFPNAKVTEPVLTNEEQSKTSFLLKLLFPEAKIKT